MNRMFVLVAALALPGVSGLLAQEGVGLPSRLVNLSTRARVGPTNTLTCGFAIGGSGTRSVLVRAAGPGLAAFGVPDALASPRLVLRDAAGAALTTNIGWADSAGLAAAFAQAGAFPFARGSADAAAIASLAPGNYTVEVTDTAGGDGGIALAEIYDLGGATDSAGLVNASARSFIAPAGGELTCGFVLVGATPRQFLLRGVGPGLARLGVDGTLADPNLSVFDSAGRMIVRNGDWSGLLTYIATPTMSAVSFTSVVTSGLIYVPQLDHQIDGAAKLSAPLTAAADKVGAFSLDLFSKDAAVLVFVAPGAYTVQLSAVPSAAGPMAVVEPITVNGGSAAAVSGGGPAAVAAIGAAASPATTPAATVASSGIALLEIYEMP